MRIPGIKRALEIMNRQLSSVGDHDVYDTNEFPWIRQIEQVFPAILEEYHAVESLGIVPTIAAAGSKANRSSSDGRWRAFPFYRHGHPCIPTHRFCPQTIAALQGVPGLLDASYSVLPGGSNIVPHRGRYNGVLRYHLGLVIPESAGIRIGSVRTTWPEGGSIVFDDCHEHEVWNPGEDTRAILNVMFLRPVPRPLAAVNRTVLKRVAASPGAVQAREAAHEWAAQL